MMKNSLFIPFLFLSTYLLSQYQIGVIPRVSPDKSIYQKIGYTEVEVKYGSPSVKDRSIWGGLVPYGKVWRAGANSATTLEISDAIEINGSRLDSGRYALFILPKENDKWTIIFNSKWKQWGAFRHNPEEDVLRVEIEPRHTTSKKEQLEYAIHQTGFKYGTIRLLWDFIELDIPLETNYLKSFEDEIQDRVSSQPKYISWIPLIQGAEHLENINSKKELAKAWINEAEVLMDESTEWNEQFYPRPYVQGHLYWTKAKILAWEGDYKAAVEYVEKLKQLEDLSFYGKRNERFSIDELYQEWKELGQ